MDRRLQATVDVFCFNLANLHRRKVNIVIHLGKYTQIVLEPLVLFVRKTPVT